MNSDVIHTATMYSCAQAREDVRNSVIIISSFIHSFIFRLFIYRHSLRM